MFAAMDRLSVRRCMPRSMGASIRAVSHETQLHLAGLPCPDAGGVAAAGASECGEAGGECVLIRDGCALPHVDSGPYE